MLFNFPFKGQESRHFEAEERFQENLLIYTGQIIRVRVVYVYIFVFHV